MSLAHVSLVTAVIQSLRYLVLVAADLLCAAALGNGSPVVAFAAAIPVGLFLQNVFLTSFGNAMFYVAETHEQGRMEDVAVSTVIILVAYALVAIAPLYALIDPVQRLLFPGLSPAASLLYRQMFPVLLAASVLGLANGVAINVARQQQRFVLANIALACPAVVQLTFYVITLPHNPVLGLAWGMVVGMAIQLLVLIPVGSGLDVHSISYKGSLRVTRHMMSYALPLFVAQIFGQCQVLVERYFLSRLDGGIAVANVSYADRMVGALINLVMTVVTLIGLPTFAKLTQNPSEFRLKLTQGFILSTIVGAFVAAALPAVGGDMVRLLFERGAFDAEASRNVSVLLAARALQVAVLLGWSLLSVALYAQGKTALMSLLWVAAGVLLTVCALVGFTLGGQVGVALATGVAHFLVGLTVLAVLQARGVASVRAEVWRFCVSLVGAAMSWWIAVRLAAWALGTSPDITSMVVLRLLASSSVALLLYGALMNRMWPQQLAFLLRQARS